MNSPTDDDTAGALPNQEPIRDERGRMLPGKTLNPTGIGAGRPKLPDWFRSRGPDALRVLLAQATGVPVACDDGKVLPAVEQVARESSCKERRQAAEAVVERIYGKAPATLEVDGELAVRQVIRRIVDPGPVDTGE
jgi:hypothetical protein